MKFDALLERLNAKEQREQAEADKLARMYHHFPGEGKAEYMNANAGDSQAERPMPRNPVTEIHDPEEFKSINDRYIKNHRASPYTQEHFDADKKMYLDVAKRWGNSFAESMHRRADEIFHTKHNNLKEAFPSQGWIDRRRVSRVLGAIPTDDVLTPATERQGFYRPLADTIINHFKPVTSKPRSIKPPQIPKAVKVSVSSEPKKIKVPKPPESNISGTSK